MPFDDPELDTSHEEIIGAFDESLTVIRNSNNKNDCIRDISEIKIKGKRKIGNKAAHRIYNKYSEYNGSVGRRKKK